MGSFLIYNKRGSLLFETLIALLILAVGVTASLRLFGQTLRTGDRNLEQARARHYLEERLFSQFAGFPEMGSKKNKNEVLPSLPEEKKLQYKTAMQSLNLIDAAPAGNQKKNDYARLKLSVLSEQGDPVLEMETVVLQKRLPV